MTEVVVHEMKYYGGKVNLNIELVNYSDEYYNDYRSICCDCFRELSIATNLNPNSFYTQDEMNKKKFNVFIMFIEKEIIGSVEIHENIIDHLFVNPKYQNKGYGKKLLFFAISRLQQAGIDEITLFVADLNKKAIQLYLNNGFKCTKTIIDNW
ncbi:GNAT family N-acetyltransferase [Clostridium senegalense]|uniref:GNAT family N-acetyltransferase n=1 Tax=Clostridium senegalense TaxID=1465809 RepID=UPI0002896E86|nr:GNAT family N-acetyltransferase [Clostridium senegalense]